eukprot:4294240-Pyramimonas_sp.AAC.1
MTSSSLGLADSVCVALSHFGCAHVSRPCTVHYRAPPLDGSGRSHRSCGSFFCHHSPHHGCAIWRRDSESPSGFSAGLAFPAI